MPAQGSLSKERSKMLRNPARALTLAWSATQQFARLIRKIKAERKSRFCCDGKGKQQPLLYACAVSPAWLVDCFSWRPLELVHRLWIRWMQPGAGTVGPQHQPAEKEKAKEAKVRNSCGPAQSK